MRHSMLAVLLVPILAPLFGAGGQTIASLQQGARIRVDPVQGKTTTGSFLGADSDSLRFMPSKSPARLTSLGLGDVESVKVSGGRSRLRGALVHGLVGLSIGAAAGGVLGAVAYEAPTSECNFICFRTSRSEDIAFGALIVGVLGGALGTITGAISGRERWESVPMRPR